MKVRMFLKDNIRMKGKKWSKQENIWVDTVKERCPEKSGVYE